MVVTAPTGTPLIPIDHDYSLVVCFLLSALQLTEYVFRPTSFVPYNTRRTATVECTAQGASTTVIHTAAAINNAYDTDASWDVVIGIKQEACSLGLRPPCRLPVFEHSPLQTWAIERMDLDMRGRVHASYFCLYAQRLLQPLAKLSRSLR